MRRRLRDRFDVTLPRFDLMAQLDKAPDGMTLSDLSKRMMVSNGNLTGLVERLVASGHLDRRTSDVGPPRPGDQPDGARPRGVPRHGGRARGLDRGPVRRSSKTEHDDLMRLLAKTKMSARRAVTGRAAREPRPANAVTLPLSGYRPAHFRLAVEGAGRDGDAEPAGEEEPAHLRELSRARRLLPRLRQG